jgi:hypothetical protein
VRQETQVRLTFGVITILAVVLMAIGVLMTRYVRWGPIPLIDTTIRPSGERRGELTITISLIVLAAIIGVLLWFWGVVALPH